MNECQHPHPHQHLNPRGATASHAPGACCFHCLLTPAATARTPPLHTLPLPTYRARPHTAPAHTHHPCRLILLLTPPPPPPPQVPCYILDLRERLFEGWAAAAVPPPSPRSRLTRAALESAIRGQDTGLRGLGGLGGAGGLRGSGGLGAAAAGGVGMAAVLGGVQPPGQLFAEGGGGFGEEEEGGLGPEADPGAVAAAEQEAAARQ